MKTGSRLLLAAFFLAAGANHFLNPRMYLAIMPPYLPFPEALNLLSGAAEVAGGAGILLPRLRRAAGWGLIALLLAVLPANVQMAQHGPAPAGIPQWALWARVPLQFVLVWWVWHAAVQGNGTPRRLNGRSDPR